MAEWLNKQTNKKTRPNYILPQETHYSFKETQKLKYEGIEKAISYKWKPKERKNSYTYIRQDKLKPRL